MRMRMKRRRWVVGLVLQVERTVWGMGMVREKGRVWVVHA